MLMFTGRVSRYSRPLPFFNNTSHSKLSFSSIMDQYHIWFCLFCAKCQCAQVKGRQPFVSSPLINTKALNISSPLRMGLRDVTVFNTRCLRNSLHSVSPSLPFLAFGFVCNSDVFAGVCSVSYLTRVHSLESSSTRRTREALTRLCVRLLIN